MFYAWMRGKNLENMRAAKNYEDNLLIDNLP